MEIKKQKKEHILRFGTWDRARHEAKELIKKGEWPIVMKEKESGMWQVSYVESQRKV